jgi:hypothetical protein
MMLAKSKSDVMKERGFIFTIKIHSKKFAVLNKCWVKIRRLDPAANAAPHDSEPPLLRN